MRVVVCCTARAMEGMRKRVCFPSSKAGLAKWCMQRRAMMVFPCLVPRLTMVFCHLAISTRASWFRRPLLHRLFALTIQLLQYQLGVDRHGDPLPFPRLFLQLTFSPLVVPCKTVKVVGGDGSGSVLPADAEGSFHRGVGEAVADEGTGGGSDGGIGGGEGVEAGAFVGR